jgi:hypothetical protein
MRFREKSTERRSIMRGITPTAPWKLNLVILAHGAVAQLIHNVHYIHAALSRAIAREVSQRVRSHISTN